MVSQVKPQSQERQEVPFHSAAEVDPDFICRVERGRLASEALQTLG